MKILALDLGTTFGWARMDELGQLEVGNRTLTGDEGERYSAFQVWLKGALTSLEGEGFVDFEDVRFSRGKSYIPGQRALLMSMCVDRGIPYVGVGVSELKKWATGDGRCGKDAMVAAAEGWISRTPTEDEADAILVARWAVENAIPDRAA